jgi:hypothetical protein
MEFFASVAIGVQPGSMPRDRVRRGVRVTGTEADRPLAGLAPGMFRSGRSAANRATGVIREKPRRPRADNEGMRFRALGPCRIGATLLALISTAVLSMPRAASAFDPSVAAGATEVLRRAPGFSGTIPAGRTFVRRMAIPPTTLVRFTLLSRDAHLSLTSPNGTGITAADTNARVRYFTVGKAGFEVFEIQDPTPGTWNLWINASGCRTGQQFTADVEFRSASTASLTVTPMIHRGDVIPVLAQLATSGRVRTDVVWMCSVRQPDGTFLPLKLYDDGAHGDALAADGIYGNRLAPARRPGVYTFKATVIAPGVGALEAVAHCELADAASAASREIRPRKATATPRPR